MDKKIIEKNIEIVRKFLLKGDDEIDAKLFEELKKNTADEKEEGALTCIKCGKLYPEAFGAEFGGKCSACAEKDFSEKLTKILKTAFAVVMVFLIVIAANYLLVRPLLGEKIALLAEHKIFGNLFKNQFIYYAFEAFSIVYVVTSYFKARGSKEDQRVVAATSVMLSVGLLMTALLFKGNGLLVADIVLLVLLALLCALVAIMQNREWQKVKTFKYASVELNAKMLQSEVKNEKSEVKVQNPVTFEAVTPKEKTAVKAEKHFGKLILSDGCKRLDAKDFVFDNYVEFSKNCERELPAEASRPTFSDVSGGEAV